MTKYCFVELFPISGYTPRYCRNTAKIGVKHQSINQSNLCSKNNITKKISKYWYNLCRKTFLAHLTPKGQVSYCHHWASVVCRPSSVCPLTFHILINSSEATGPIWTKLWWNGSWMTPFQNCVRWSRLPTKMAAKLKIEKRGDEILIVHCCFSISQNELKF